MSIKLSDLENHFPEKIKEDSSVFLIRKLSNEVLEVYFEKFIIGAHPVCTVYWDRRHRYKLNLIKNQVCAIDATATHKQNMFSWYVIWEPHREMLIAEFYIQKKRG